MSLAVDGVSYATASGTKVDTRSIILTAGNPQATELLESAAKLTRGIKLYDKVSSLRGANPLLQGQQINGQTHRRQINCRRIKAADRRRDQHRSQKTRSQEI
jgi:hypothetical protein